jgi:hypothetical protein
VASFKQEKAVMKKTKTKDINGLISSKSVTLDSKKRLLEAEMFQRSHEIRNFDRLKYSLTKEGEDDAAAFKRLSAAREQLLKRIRLLGDSSSRTVAAPVGAHLELTAPRFGHAGEGIFVFGTEGCVALPRASDGISVVPSVSAGHGRIQTTELGPFGNVQFGSDGTEFGYLEVDGTSLTERVWLHNWLWVVLFPCTSSASYLTYTFTVNVEAQLFSEATGSIMSFVSVGERPSVSPNSGITVNIPAGWPLIAGLDEPSDFYNGSYGFKHGSLEVQRTFAIGAGRTPALAIVVGFVARLTDGRLRLQFEGDSGIGFNGGQVCYRYTPIPILSQE